MRPTNLGSSDFKIEINIASHPPSSRIHGFSRDKYDNNTIDFIPLFFFFFFFFFAISRPNRAATFLRVSCRGGDRPHLPRKRRTKEYAGRDDAK